VSHESLKVNIIDLKASTEDATIIERACANFCALRFRWRLGYGSALLLVRAETLIAWYRAGFGLFWKRTSASR
jgi:hypothetical protein